MKLNKRYILIFFCCFLSFFAKAQSDTIFWFAAPAITPDHANEPIYIRFSAYAAAADVTVSMPANPSFQAITFTLNPNTTITKDLTAFLNILESKPENIVLRTGIKITATNKISAYYEVDGVKNGNFLNPDIFTLKGVAGMGTKFMIPGQNTFDNIPFNNNANTIKPHNGFVVVATENNTVVNITPSKDAAGHPAGQAFSITLQAGETYSVIASSLLGSQHLVASVINSNKPISVTVYDDSIGVLGGNYDLVGDQIVSEDIIGIEYIIVRGELILNSVTRDYFYVLATVDGTDVFMDGVRVATINRGEIYSGTLANPSTYIRTTNPVYINQLTGTGGEMASTNLPSIHCTGSQEVSFVRPLSGAFNLALLCKATDIGNFALDGNTTSITPAMFSAVPGTNGEWMYAKINEFNISPRIRVGVPAVVTNKGFFHLGFFNGIGGGSLMGYFSNYTKITLSPKVIGTQCVGNNLLLQSNEVSGAIYAWSGPNNFSASTFNTSFNNIAANQAGTYHVSASLIGCGSFTDSIAINIHPLPTATISMNDSICLGKSKTLAFTFTGTVPWNFSISDGTKIDTIHQVTSLPYNLTVNPLVKTTYSIQHITDTNFCTSNLSNGLNVSSIVNIYPQPTASFTLSSPLCESREVLFTDKSLPGAGNIVRWNWDFKDGSVKDLISGTPFKKAFVNYGNYPVRLMVENNKGCKSDTIVLNTKINPLPIVGYVLPEVCVTDGSATFTDTSTIADGSQSQFIWNWTIYPGINNNKQPVFVNANAQNAKVIVTREDFYKTLLKVTSKDGCTDSLFQQITVNGPTPKASFVVQKSDSLCSNDFTRIINTSTVDFGNVTKLDIYWDAINTPANKITDQNPADGSIYNNWYPNLPNPAVQTYMIKLTAYSGNAASCQNTVSKIVTVYPQPKANFSSSAVEICANNSIQFTDLSNGITSVVNKWHWDFSNNKIASVPNPLTRFTDSGNRQVSLFVTNTQGCVSDTAIKQILVYPNPVLKMAGSKIVLEGASVSLSPEFVYGSQLSYLWTPSQYLNNDTALAPISTPSFNITYRLLVTGIGGCSLSDTLFVKVLKNPVIPNAFSPNGDGINDVWVIRYLDSYEGATVDIYNRYGQKVYNSIGYNIPWNGKYNGKTLPVGTYYYVINPKNGRQVLSGSITILL